MDWITEYTPHIISLVAIVLSVLSFYYIHLQGPKFRFEHISWNLQGTGVDTQYRHTIAIINDGNKSGLIRDIKAKTNSKTPVSIKRVKVLRGSERFELSEEKKAIAIGPKESIILLVDSNLSDVNVKKGDEIPDYCIEILYDKAIIFNVYERKWSFNSPFE